MSRSADNQPGRAGAGVLLLSAFALLAVTGAVSAAEPPSSAPVLPITAPVVAIHTGTATVDDTAAVEDQDRHRTTARLDSNVLFAKDSDRLRPAARATIADLARQLRRDKPGRITVTGYTDDLGPASHGLRLSRRRAGAVAHQLDRHLGSDWPTITVHGKGEADPAVPNTSETNRKLNRRVVITVQR